MLQTVLGDQIGSPSMGLRAQLANLPSLKGNGY